MTSFVFSIKILGNQQWPSRLGNISTESSMTDHYRELYMQFLDVTRLNVTAKSAAVPMVAFLKPYFHITQHNLVIGTLYKTPCGRSYSRVLTPVGCVDWSEVTILS